jgi:uncharacterized protein (UPF0264 family)
MLLNQFPPKFLASVTSLHEAQLAIDADVDIIDLKNPLEGALGALPLQVVNEIVALVNNRQLVSATIGDLPMNPLLIKSAVDHLTLTGVDIIKVGFFGNENHLDCINLLKQYAKINTKIVAVLFADQQPNIELLDSFMTSGFYGVMLDTANKSSGGLLKHQSIDFLLRFTHEAKSLGLFSGLAGSLTEKEISELKKTGVDYLGFRGALCSGENRQSEIVFEKLIRIKKSISL